MVSRDELSLLLFIVAFRTPRRSDIVRQFVFEATIISFAAELILLESRVTYRSGHFDCLARVICALEWMG